MPIVVKVLAEDEFDAWMAEQKQAAATAAEEAQAALSETMSMMRPWRLANRSIWRVAPPVISNGAGLQGVFPALKGSAIAIGPMAAHLDIVIHGKTGTAMQPSANR